MLQILPASGRGILSDFVQPVFTKAPAEDPKIARAIEAIRRTPSGAPWYRLVWGEQAVLTVAGQPWLPYWRAKKSVHVGWRQGDLLYPPDVDKSKLPALPLLVMEKKDVWIGQPVWVLEEWVSPEKLAPGWEAQRRQYSAREQQWVDHFGDLPPHGCYRCVCIITTDEMGYQPLFPGIEQILRGVIYETSQSELDDPEREQTPERMARRARRAGEEYVELAKAAQAASAAVYEQELLNDKNMMAEVLREHGLW